MTGPQLPWYVVPLCIVTGFVLIAAGIPLYLRRVPPNRFYGVRLRSTLANESIWYEVNAKAGRDFVVIGAVYIVLLALTLRFAHSWSIPFRLLAPTIVLVIGLIIDSATVASTARKLATQQAAPKPST